MEHIFITCTASSIGVAISLESIFTLAPVARHFWHGYELRCFIPSARVVRAFLDRPIQLIFRHYASRVRGSIQTYGKCPHDLDPERAVLEVRELGME